LASTTCCSNPITVHDPRRCTVAGSGSSGEIWHESIHLHPGTFSVMLGLELVLVLGLGLGLMGCRHHGCLRRCSIVTAALMNNGNALVPWIKMPALNPNPHVVQYHSHARHACQKIEHRTREDLQWSVRQGIGLCTLRGSCPRPSSWWLSPVVWWTKAVCCSVHHACRVCVRVIGI
jgi:hypothetical protein